jgi:hypothetical protein
VLPYTVLKVLAFQDRHQNKDAYDLIFTLLNFSKGPRAAGGAARTSPVAEHPQVKEGLAWLAERFNDAADDGPSSYGLFLVTRGERDEEARLRREAVATVREFLRGFRGE